MCDCRRLSPGNLVAFFYPPVVSLTSLLVMRHLLLLSAVSLSLGSASHPGVLPVALHPVAPMVGPGGPVPLADSIVIEKKGRRLTLYHQGRPLRSYIVALGANPVGDKRF